MRLRQSQLSHLAALQYGSPLPTSLTFRAELSSLCHIRPTNTAFQTFFERQNVTSERNSHIVHIAPSPDRSLAAVASSNGLIELHEPSVDDSHRLTLERVAPYSRLSALLYPSNFVGDHVLAAASNVSDIYHYDVQKCRVDKPTTQFKIPRPTKSIMDIAEMERTPFTFAASLKDELFIFDSRQGRKVAISAEMPLSVSPRLVAQGHSLVVGTECRLLTYDWRKFPKPRNTSQKVVSFQASANAKSAVSTTDLVDDEALRPLGPLYSICPLPGAPDGYFFFQTEKGVVGTVDVMSHHINLLKESRPSILAQDDLHDYGHAFAAFNDFGWHVGRRRVDVIRGTGGRGWRALVPNLHKRGVRVVAVADDMPLLQFSIPILKDVDVTTVLGVDGKLDKLIVGTAKNDVKSFEIDMGWSFRKQRDQKECSSTTQSNVLVGRF